MKDLALAKPPRVRVAECPWCNRITPIDRKKRGEEVHISNCYYCFSIFHVNDSRLIDYATSN